MVFALVALVGIVSYGISKVTVVNNQSENNFFKVTVDYNESLKDMISAGKYDWVNPGITEKNFPVKGTGKSEVEVEIVHYNKAMTSEQVFADFKAHGLKPAPVEVGLALGKDRPDLQREFPIVMLGSVWQSLRGDRRTPFLWGGAGARDLSLNYFDEDWHWNYRFLAVREP